MQEWISLAVVCYHTNKKVGRSLTARLLSNVLSRSGDTVEGVRWPRGNKSYKAEG